MGGLQAASGDQDIDLSEIRLQELGYKQEFRRNLAPWESGVVGACNMNPFITIVPYIYIGLSYGGPVVIVWSWWIVVAFNICIGLALAEICSSFPTVGSLYFWSSSLVPIKYKPIVAWYTAWFEIIALMIGIGTIAFATTALISSVIVLWTGGNGSGGYYPPRWLFYIMYCIVIATWGLLNSMSAKSMAFFNLNYFWFNFFFCTVFVVTISFVTPNVQSASFVFTKWYTMPDVFGVKSDVLNVILGTTLAQFSFFGYDVGAHISEETQNADKSGPYSIMGAILIEAVFGYALIIALIFCIQDDIGELSDPANIARGNVVAFIVYRAFNVRYGNAYGAYVFLILMVYPFYSGGASQVMSAGRAVFAVSRDGVMPASRLWRRLHSTTKVPINAVWLTCIVAMVVGLPMLKSDAAYYASASVLTIAWVASYAPPMFFRAIMPDGEFKPGRFSLGKWAKPLCIIGVLYVIYTCSVFMIPVIYPITWDNFNYGPVGFAGVLLLVTLWWLVDARFWFEGPHRTIDDPSINMQNMWGTALDMEGPRHDTSSK